MRHSLPYRMLRKRPMKLSTTVILMVSAVLFSVLLVVHLIYFSQISDMTRDGLANKALAVARTLADSPEIRQGLQKKPQESGIQAIADIVLNQRLGTDGCEDVLAQEVSGSNRTQTIGDKQTISAWTRFDFPGRAGAYSDFTWDWTCFHGVDWDDRAKRKAVFLFDGKHWDAAVDCTENSSYDYLMGADVDVNDPRVYEELVR